MAVNTGKNEFDALASGLSAATAAPQPNVGAQPQGGAQQAQPEFKQNFAGSTGNNPRAEAGRGLLNMAKRSVSFNPMGAKVQAFFTAFEELIGGIPNLSNNEQTYKLMTFEGASNGVRANALLLTLAFDKFVAVYPWLVEDAIEPLQDKVYNFPNQPSINIPQLTEELVTSATAVPEAIRRYVEYAFNGKQVVVIDGLVLPSILEAHNTAQLERVLSRAIDALEYARDILKSEVPRFTILRRAADEQLVIRQDFNAQGIFATATGLPVRSDINIKMLVNKSTNKASSLGENVSAPFSIARMHMELMYIGDKQPMGQPMYNHYGQPILPPLFQPYAIINSLDNQFFGATLESQLLAISTAASVIPNQAWVNAYKPNYALPEFGTDPRDIGAITLDVNFPGEPLGYTNTKEQGFNLHQFIQRYLNPNPIFQMDIAEFGDLTYLQRVWLEASGVTGDVELTNRANAIIVDAANYLTDGIFSRYWTTNKPVVVNQVGRIELGHFTNEKGERHDLHEIDYLYLANRANVESARDYMNSLDPNFAPEIVRFDMRRRIYEVWAPGYELTGFAQRLTLDSDFVIALDRALKEAGGHAVIETFHNVGQTVERGYINQIVGVGMNQISQFSQGGYNPGFNMGGMPNQTWRTYNAQQAPMYNYGAYQPR